MDESRHHVSELLTMQGQTEPKPAVIESESGPDARVSLLAEVDFKWLMAGQGWWIDVTRLHGDPSYAAGLIRFALSSHSFALRGCAALLQAQIGSPEPPDGGGMAPDELFFTSQSSMLADERSDKRRAQAQSQPLNLRC